MPLKCYNKPNRTRVRTFKVCDAARIAREVNKDDGNMTPEIIMACIAKGFGFTHISLSRPGTVVVSAINLSKTTTLLRKGVEAALSLSRKLDIKSISNLLIRAIEIIDAIDILIDGIFQQPGQERVDDVLPEGVCQCKKVVR